MNQCPVCGQRRQGDARKCPKCDVFFSKIDEFLAEEEAKDEQTLFKTRVKKIWAADDRKQAFKQELKTVYSELPQGSLFVLYVVIAFIFAMTLVVL